MKKTKITAFALAAVLSSTPVLAAEIPQEAVPVYLTGESVCITEKLISDIVNNSWHIFLKHSHTYAVISKEL